MSIVTGLIYIGDTMQNPKKIPTIRIENFGDLGKELNMAQPAQVPTPPPPKPSFPENRVIKEGTIPKR
jgi:hypothetical protein